MLSLPKSYQKVISTYIAIGVPKSFAIAMQEEIARTNQIPIDEWRGEARHNKFWV